MTSMSEGILLERMKSDSRWDLRWDPLTLPEMVVTIAPNNQPMFLYEGVGVTSAKVEVGHTHVMLFMPRLGVGAPAPHTYAFYRRFLKYHIMHDDIITIVLEIPLQHVTRMSWSDLKDHHVSMRDFKVVLQK